MLTQILRDNPEVAKALASLVDLSTVDATPLPIQAPPMTDHYALVGTAFDYFVRWELERRNPMAKDRDWVATTAVRDILPGMVASKLCPGDVALTYRRIVENALDFHAMWVADRRFGNMPRPKVEAAAKLVLGLAKIDPLFRTGTLDPDANVFDRPDVTDLVNLYETAPWEQLGGVPNVPLLLNPDFGRWSERLLGADADLVVDRTLVDLKTSKYHDITKHLAQLVGYYALGELYRGDNPDYPVVESAGIYWCRHGYLETFPTIHVHEHPHYDDAVELLLSTADRVVADVMKRKKGVVA